MGSFEQLGLPTALSAQLKAVGLQTPTPIQEQAIPLLLAGRDAILLAKTGSGKTLAFGLPLLAMIKPGSQPQALVIVPTRELAIQVAGAIAEVGATGPLKLVALYGGVGLKPQVAALEQGIDVVVGTPGRLKDLLDRGHLSLGHIRLLVLDEADKMLEMGFKHELDALLAQLPAQRQTLMLSATLADAMLAIARQHLSDPVVVRLNEQEMIPEEIRHYFIRLKSGQRLAGLWALLQKETPQRALIFTQMKHDTRALADKLARLLGVATGYLHGNMSQNARNNMLERFRSGELRFLVATDVAARGLDIEGVSHVIHYTVPAEVNTYVHRSGRTGRAGHTGKTIIFVTPDGEAVFKAICSQVPFREIPAQQLGPLPAEPTNQSKQRAAPPIAAENREQRRQALQKKRRPRPHR